MILNVILAVDQKFGIGINGILPWRISDELQIFREKTRDSVVICGRKTYEKLPLLVGRDVFVISRIVHTDINATLFDSIERAIEIAQIHNKPIFIIGGSQIYNYIFIIIFNSFKSIVNIFWHYSIFSF